MHYYLRNELIYMLYSTLNYKYNIDSEYLGERIHNLLDLTFEIPTSYAYNIFEVTQEYIARPDLVSLDAYGDTMFADVICKLNGISNPFELNIGTKLVIPSPENIMEFTRKPYDNEIDENWGANAIGGVSKTTKIKESKRQPNEAIVGDTRFKIDSATGLIIY